MTNAGVDSADESLVVIARAVKARGLKGEIVAEILTDFPERFEKVNTLTAVSPAGERRRIDLESYWFQKHRVILKLIDIDTIESAQALIGYDFGVPETERVPLNEGQYYDWELEGCTVSTTAQLPLGRVTSVMRTGGVELLVVTDEKTDRDYLVPIAEAIIRHIDPIAKTIVIDPPEGLLDL
jgi:16S rRNA processing protein RimM